MQVDLLAGTTHRPAVLARPVPTILVFDSGLGGLTVLARVGEACRGADIVYAADDAGFPYGRLEEGALVARVLAVMERLVVRHRPDLVVIACNTASTLVLSHLRAAYSVPFVGTVPAIKPACAASKTRRVSVLGTRGTVKREYTRKLIADFAQGCDVTLVGAEHLASLAEAVLRGETISDAAIAAEIAPCFLDGTARTDTVVLACTHYPLLLDRLTALAPWRVDWIDPAPAIARRVGELLGPPHGSGNLPPSEFILTSGQRPSPVLSRALDGFFPARAVA